MRLKRLAAVVRWLPLAVLACLPSFARDGADLLPEEEIPPAIRPFVLEGTLPLALEKADLDGDGLQDAVLVLEKQKTSPDAPDIEEGQRPLLVLLGQPDGSYRLAKRNDRIVYCSTCGGIMGDPFQWVEVGPRTFTVHHYGGSAWRWSNAFTFNYSRRDHTWQLVRVETRRFNAADPGNVDVTVETPPRDFGKIDIADFDPDDYQGKGLR
jgi:hypothetical protein